MPQDSLPRDIAKRLELLRRMLQTSLCYCCCLDTHLDQNQLWTDGLSICPELLYLGGRQLGV
jgi:hypothetical protein